MLCCVCSIPEGPRLGQGVVGVSLGDGAEPALGQPAAWIRHLFGDLWAQLGVGLLPGPQLFRLKTGKVSDGSQMYQGIQTCHRKTAS